jgi:hypothetical protein
MKLSTHQLVLLSFVAMLGFAWVALASQQGAMQTEEPSSCNYARVF